MNTTKLNQECAAAHPIDQTPIETDLPQDVRESLMDAVRSYPVRDILDYIAEVMRESSDEIGYEEDQRVMEDDARIVAHAAAHVKG